MALSPGARLGVYEITAQIGEGGMGQVYQAIDTTLGRQVAIKILPETFASDPDRLARFEREGKTLASLNHPHIAAIFGFEQSSGLHALVMELVEGDDLSQRIARGPLPLDEALAIARQIAAALEASHQLGIVHRDLKPANIRIRPDGTVKVLDFGLAKAMDQAAGFNQDATPTLSGNATIQGVILGTAAYMSPEQARGLPVDRRTDIWAFGCVLYEMLTGAQAFDSKSLSDAVAAVLLKEPDWDALPANTPANIRVLLKRCLQKDARQRLHDAADARIELEDREAEAPSQLAAPGRADPHRLMRVVLSVLSGAALASAVWWFGSAPSRTPAATPIHLGFTLANESTPFTHMNGSRELAISPDGQKIVYVATRNGRRQLFLRTLADSDARPIEGTDGAVTAFFSPDSHWIAFNKGAELQKAAVSGGSPTVICSLSGTGFFGGDWGADDTIVFIPDYNDGLWTVPAAGGTPELLLKTSLEKDRVAFSDPQALPGSKGILFTLASGRAVTADDLDMAVLEPGAAEPRILMRGASHARYLRTGQIIYVHAGELLAVGFDVSSLAITGTPVPVIEGLGKVWSGDTDYSVSDNGTILYLTSVAGGTGGLLVQADRRGNVRAISARRGNYSEFSVSPNGRSIASRAYAINDDIWTYDVATGAPLRFTFEPLDEIFPHWTADGSRIAYGTRTGTIYWKPSDGSGTREELTRGMYARYPSSFSRDGKLLAFVEIHPSRRRDVWLMPLQGARTPEPVMATDADERDASFSPDGQWLAYVSDETGRDEVFIRPVSSQGARRQVSSEGGTGPVWAPDGRELYFASGDHISAITLDGQANPVGRDRLLLSTPKYEDLRFGAENPLFDIMPDGEHFVLLLEQASSLVHYNVVLNWFDELKARTASR